MVNVKYMYIFNKLLNNNLCLNTFFNANIRHLPFVIPAIILKMLKIFFLIVNIGKQYGDIRFFVTF